MEKGSRQHERTDAIAEESILPVLGAVDELADEDEIARLHLLLQAAHCGHSHAPAAAQLL